MISQCSCHLHFLISSDEHFCTCLWIICMFYLFACSFVYFDMPTYASWPPFKMDYLGSSGASHYSLRILYEILYWLSNTLNLIKSNNLIHVTVQILTEIKCPFVERKKKLLSKKLKIDLTSKNEKCVPSPGEHGKMLSCTFLCICFFSKKALFFCLFYLIWFCFLFVWLISWLGDWLIDF